MEVDTISDEDPKSIKAAVEEALSEAFSDNTVGNLNVDPESAIVDEPHVPKTETGKGHCSQSSYFVVCKIYLNGIYDTTCTEMNKQLMYSVS